MDAPSNIPVAFRPIYHTFSNSWYIILCRCFYTKTRPFPFLQVAGRGFALQGGNLSAQNSWLGPGTQHQLFRIAMVCHHSSSFSSILSIFSIAMTCNDYLYNLGIFGVYHGFFHFWQPAFGTSSRCLGDALMPRQWPRAISHTRAFIFAS
jgi:hypothetical protein